MAIELTRQWEKQIEHCVSESIIGFRLFSPLKEVSSYNGLLDNIEKIIKDIKDPLEQEEALVSVLPIYKLGALLLQHQSRKEREKVQIREKEFCESLGIAYENNQTLPPVKEDSSTINAIQEALLGDRNDLRSMLNELVSFKSLQEYQPALGSSAMYSEDLFNRIYDCKCPTLEIIALCTHFIPPHPFLPLHFMFIIISIFESALESRQKDVGIWGDYLHFITEHFLRFSVYILGQESDYYIDKTKNVNGNVLSNTLFKMASDIFQMAISNTVGAVRPICMYLKAYECIMKAFGVSQKNNILTHKIVWTLVKELLLVHMQEYTKYPDRPEMYSIVLSMLIRSSIDEEFEPEKTYLISLISFRVCKEFISDFTEEGTQMNIAQEWTELFLDAVDIIEGLGFDKEVIWMLTTALHKKNQQLQLLAKNKRFLGILMRVQNIMACNSSSETDDIVSSLVFNNIENIDLDSLSSLRSLIDKAEMQTEFNISFVNAIPCIHSFEYSEFMLGFTGLYTSRNVHNGLQRMFRLINDQHYRIQGCCTRALMTSPINSYPLKYIRYLIHSAKSIRDPQVQKKTNVTFVYTAPQQSQQLSGVKRKAETDENKNDNDNSNNNSNNNNNNEHNKEELTTKPENIVEPVKRKKKPRSSSTSKQTLPAQPTIKTNDDFLSLIRSMK